MTSVGVHRRHRAAGVLARRGAEIRTVTGITVFAGMFGVTLFGLFTPVFYGRCASSRIAR